MNEPILIEQKERIKIEKNTKGFNWEISILPQDGTMLTSKDFDRLENLMNETKKRTDAYNLIHGEQK